MWRYGTEDAKEEDHEIIVQRNLSSRGLKSHHKRKRIEEELPLDSSNCMEVEYAPSKTGGGGLANSGSPNENLRMHVVDLSFLKKNTYVLIIMNVTKDTANQ
ncbi:unnamed protein product [Cuscuta epithymum]|uniref:Uncharacterized protein n=1 Tax=Cuscuta epithymum TaxID=186058 RepID=A0AAV0F3P0_9ASTE|nr:unnamed protein product [Cuscuta epithymum]